MKNYFTLLLLGASISAQAQFATVADSNATNLANMLVGTGTNVQNAQLTCSGGAAGSFSDGNLSNLGIAEGVTLTTGLVSAIADSATGFGATPLMSPGDSSLAAIVGTNTYDACILEFDVTVAGDSLMLNYVFGSEEYPEFQCTMFNDVFAFQLSGPKPAGGNYNEENIALVPGSTLPVSINNVNDGNFSGGGFCTVNNSAYYVDNATGTTVVFDGFTIPLTAVAATIPGQTYHMRFAIADASDGVFDSAVFLESNSLRSGNPASVSSTVAQLSSLSPNPATGSAVLRNMGSGDLVYQILGMNGSVVLEGRVAARATANLDLGTLAPGTYILRSTNSQGVQNTRLSIQH